MSKRDYYEVLGVNPSASEEELKKAYRRRANRIHPDRASSQEEANQLNIQFQELQDAYKVLSDPNKRKLYDQYGHEGVERAAAGGSTGGGYDFGDVFGDFGDIFGDIFGGRRGSSSKQRAQRGADLQYTLNINLEDAVFGHTASIKVPRLVHCQTCQGSGARPGTQPVSCGSCGGVGQVYLQHGPFSIQQTCPDCKGKGQRISSPCPACKGRGQVREIQTLSVQIPAGIDEGNQIRLSGEGEAGAQNGPSGDLYVQIHLNPHPLFRRKDQNLYCEVPISYATAALGGEIEVPTLEGKVRLHVPVASSNGQMLKLKGKGIPKGRYHSAGDLFLTIFIETPVKLTEHQKNLIRELESSLKDSEQQYPRAHQWMNRIKQFFSRKVSHDR